MKNKTEKMFCLIKFLNDILVIVLGFIAAYFFKFKITLHPHAQVEPYVAVLPFVVILWLIAFGATGLYRHQKGLLAKMNEVINIFKGCLLGSFEVMAFTFIYQDFPESRYVVFYSFLIINFLMIVNRLLIFKIQEFCYAKGFGSKNVLIIGANDLSQMLAEKMINYQELGFNLKGFLIKRKPLKVRYYLKNKLKVLGKPENYQQVLTNHRIKAVFVTENILDEKHFPELVTFCASQNIELSIIPNLFKFNLAHIEYYQIEGVDLIAVKRLGFTLYQKVLKRLFDLIVAGLLLVLFSPLMLLIALLIKVSSSGPVFYLQKRVTIGGKVFNFIKFRSMKLDAEKNTGPIFTVNDFDSRTTALGKFLRKTSLDELPQLINVFKGEMSLVGPRPERPFFVNKFRKTVKGYEERFLIKGGITGWAQVNGRAALTLNPAEKLSYDLFYIKNWSFLFDIQILLKTVLDVLLQKEVY